MRIRRWRRCIIIGPWYQAWALTCRDDGGGKGWGCSTPVWLLGSLGGSRETITADSSRFYQQSKRLYVSLHACKGRLELILQPSHAELERILRIDAICGLWGAPPCWHRRTSCASRWCAAALRGTQSSLPTREWLRMGTSVEATGAADGVVAGTRGAVVTRMLAGHRATTRTALFRACTGSVVRAGFHVKGAELLDQSCKLRELNRATPVVVCLGQNVHRLIAVELDVHLSQRHSQLIHVH